MKCMVYLLTFSNGMFYVGSTNSLERRKREHISSLRSGKHSNDKLLAAYRETGMFIVSSVACRNREEAYRLEDDILSRYSDHTGICNELKSALPGIELSDHVQENHLCQLIDKLTT